MNRRIVADAGMTNPKKNEADKSGCAKPMQGIRTVGDRVCRVGGFCLSALKWMGVGVLFAAGFVVDGVKKLWSQAAPLLKSTGKKDEYIGRVFHEKEISSEKTKAAQTEFTIVPTRPEDYRGMRKKRSHAKTDPSSARSKRIARTPKKKNSLGYFAAMVFFMCIAVVSLYMIGSITWRSISTKRLNDTLSQRYSELSSAQDMGNDADAVGDESITDDSQEAEPVLIAESIAEDQEQQAEEIAVKTPEPVRTETVRTTQYHQVGGDALPEMEALYRENRDLIGWLRMEGILDLPVVYKDNEYYLTRDFYKNKSASGTLFLDVNHPFKEKTQNLLLHGHNMKDGTMFGRLVQYETNIQFLKNNPFIQYSTLWRKEQYVIFAVLRVSLDVQSEEFFNYFSYPTFSSDAQFENHVRSLQNRSKFSIPVDVEPTDALLTLSTCLDEDRLVIVARRVREGESKSELRRLVQLADRQ